MVRYSTSLTWSGASPVSLLSLADVQGSDSGAITCHANNSFGSATKTFHLTVLEPPKAPSGLSVSLVTARSVLLSWRAPRPFHLPLLAYVVRYSGGRRGTQEVSTNGQTQETQLRSLSPGNR